MRAECYRVFVRDWWRRAPNGGREPGAGRKSYRGHPQHATMEEARSYCQQWNATHKPGFLSRKAEFESY
jgi:hypothetical protein